MKKNSKKKSTQKTTNSSSSTNVSTKELVSQGKGTQTLLGVVIALVALNLLLTLSIILGFSGASDSDEKLTRLDNFFVANFPGYGDDLAPGQQPPAGGDQQQPQGNVEVNLDGVRYIGDTNAPVVVTKYSDFRCGFCGQFHSETYDQLKAEYVDTGLVRFVYKDFPVVGGQDAANAAWCAYEQGAFWEYHSGLFALGSAMSDATMTQLAEDLGLDTNEFTECYTSQRYNDRVNQEAQEASANGVSGTPTFVINGEVLVGARPFQDLAQVIERQLGN